MIVGHVMGLPVEESIAQLAPAGAATMTALAFAARVAIGRVKRRLGGRRPQREAGV